MTKKQRLRSKYRISPETQPKIPPDRMEEILEKLRQRDEKQRNLDDNVV